jgi:hypothetical protein
MYCQIRGAEKLLFDALPERIMLLDGFTRTGLADLSPEELAGIGVYPVVGEPPEFDPDTQQIQGPTLELAGDVVEASWAVEDLPPEEAAEKLEAAKAAKRSEIESAYMHAVSVGIEAMPDVYPGKLFSIQETSIGRFAVALQRAEAANQSTVALYTIDDELLANVPFATAKAGFVACFDAAAMLDAKYRALMKAIDAAASIDELGAITWLSGQ